MKKIAIMQSNYIPWKGYFDMIERVDEFILFDDVQFTRRDWRNRNLIKTMSGTSWLTIPVEVKGKFHQKIKDTLIADPFWNEKHWKTLKYYYTNAKWFSHYKGIIEELYLTCDEKYISLINYKFILKINELLDIKTPVKFSSDYDLVGDKTERLVNLCLQTNADCYLSGPAAKVYIMEDIFSANKIKLEWMDYENYPVYNQLFPPFVHQVSVLDLLFNEGPDCRKYLNTNQSALNNHHFINVDKSPITAP